MNGSKNSLISMAGAISVLLPVFSQAAVLVDSIGGTAGATEGALSSIGKAVVFTTGSNAYQIDNAQVTLRRATTSTTDPIITAAIYGSRVDTDGSIKVASTQIVSFTVPTIPANGTSALYTLTPTAAITLAANTTYFFVLFNTESSATSWMYNTGLPASPTGGGFSIPTDINPTAAGNQIGLYSEDWQSDTAPATWTGNSGVYNDLVINGTLIPEPSAVALLSTLGLLGMVRRRR